MAKTTDKKVITTTTRTPTINMAKRGGLLIGSRDVTTVLRRGTRSKKRRTKESRFLMVAFMDYMLVSTVGCLGIEAKKQSTGKKVCIDDDVVKGICTSRAQSTKDEMLPIYKLFSTLEFVGL